MTIARMISEAGWTRDPQAYGKLIEGEIQLKRAASRRRLLKLFPRFAQDCRYVDGVHFDAWSGLRRGGGAFAEADSRTGNVSEAPR